MFAGGSFEKDRCLEMCACPKVRAKKTWFALIAELQPFTQREENLKIPAP